MKKNKLLKARQLGSFNNVYTDFVKLIYSRPYTNIARAHDFLVTLESISGSEPLEIGLTEVGEDLIKAFTYLWRIENNEAIKVLNNLAWALVEDSDDHIKPTRETEINRTDERKADAQLAISHILSEDSAMYVNILINGLLGLKK